MSVADKDGWVAQIVADMHACLGMELGELAIGLREKTHESPAQPD